MTYAVMMFDDRKIVKAWIEENLEDMREGSTYFFQEDGEDTYVHFISQQDAWDFEEDYENA